MSRINGDGSGGFANHAIALLSAPAADCEADAGVPGDVATRGELPVTPVTVSREADAAPSVPKTLKGLFLLRTEGGPSEGAPNALQSALP